MLAVASKIRAASAKASTSLSATDTYTKLSSFFQLRTMSAVSSDGANLSFPVEASIIRKLNDALDPAVLKVMNESHMHNV
jgi:hypothetical protein